ncbi:MAG: hypothetical protein ABJN40_13170 [Sneathiella sp.]
MSAMLERTRTRKSVIARLLAANTDAAGRVKDSVVNNVAAEECPLLSVYTLTQNGDGDASHLPAFDTNLNLKIDAYVVASEDWSDRLDNLCEQVEATLLRNPDFVKEYSGFTSYSTNIQLESDGEKPVASAAIQIGLRFRQEFEPIIPDNLKTTDITVVDMHGNTRMKTGISHKE